MRQARLWPHGAASVSDSHTGRNQGGLMPRVVNRRAMATYVVDQKLAQTAGYAPGMADVELAAV
jgi:hypothetical protein